MTNDEKTGPCDETGPHENADSDTEYTRDPRQILAAARGYCVLVESAHGRYRRRLYLSLNSAEKAVQRAKESGKYAALVLATITPCEVIA